MDLQLSKTEARYLKKQDRLEEYFGWPSTTGPMAITQTYIKTLTDRVSEFLVAKSSQEVDFIKLISELPKEKVALCSLQSALQVIGSSSRGMASSLVRIGRALEGECYAQGLLKFDAELSKRLERMARSRHGNIKYRRQAVRSIARKNNFAVEQWSHKQLVIAGNWAMNFVLSVLPMVFSVVIVNDRGEKELALTEDAFDLAEKAITEAIHANPVYLPSTDRPLPWTDWDVGGPRDTRLKRQSHILRSRHAETAAHVRKAIKDGTMQPALEALNNIQNVGWKINERILTVIRYCHSNAVSVKSLPRSKDLELPKRTKPWEEMDDDEKKLWKIRASEVKLRNRGFTAERVLMYEDLATAEYLLDKTFYTPHNMDWRGRVYPMCHFNYQREDRVRALFLFSEGMPMTEEGLYWLKVHVANTGDFDKVSKKAFDERVEWVNENIQTIFALVDDPFNVVFWHKADKPFMFLAACIELVSAIKDPKHVTHLPIAFDGTCSGLQHLSAMTQAAEGALVNLTHSEKPQDVYTIVAERVHSNLLRLQSSNQASDTEKNLAKVCLEYGVNRSLVKRNVMTYGYSSQKFGMGSQLLEDLMQPLALEVLSGDRPYHPFGPDNGFAASRFLASQIFNAIEEVVKKPAEAMAFLRQIAKALAHENKPASWITPVGVPWINRYHASTVQRVTLWLSDKGVTLKHSVSVANGWQKQIDKSKAANSIAPNFVHALDASHLMMTVNGLVEEGINDIALVHDSFGVHCSNSRVLSRVLREQFVRLYTEFDPLNDILDYNQGLMVNPSRLPTPVSKGSLDLEDIMNAEYAFS